MMPITLISVSQMVKRGFPAHFEKTSCKILMPRETILTVVSEKRGLYPLLDTDPTATRSETALATDAPVSITLTELHLKMAHSSAPALKKMVVEGVVEGVQLSDTEIPFCETCVKAKQAQQPFPKERSSPPATVYGQRVHSDVWGKAAVRSLGGNEYFVTFLDDYSDEATVVPMKKKGEVFTRYKQYEASVKNQRAVKEIKELQSDRGGEYMSAAFTDHLKARGTVQRLTTHDSPQQNGKAERLNRTLVEHARAMLLDAKLPRTLWVEAVRHAAYVRNRTTTKNTPGTTPYERATGEKPNLAKMPRFGQEVFVLIEAPSKLDAKSKSARWVGFDDKSKAHRVYWPEKRSISVERNLVFVPETPKEAVVLPEGENSPISSQTTPQTSTSTPSELPKPPENDSTTPPAPPEDLDSKLASKAKPEEPSAPMQPPTDHGEPPQQAEGLPGSRKRKPSP